MDKCILEKFGFTNDDGNMSLTETFKDGEKLKEIHMELYPYSPFDSHSPFELLIRTIQKNVGVSNDGNRLILKMNDGFGTYIMNILLSDITKCFVEKVDETYSTFILNIQDIWYRIIVHRD